jgi:DNA-binding transcriptional LysR family regulator
VTQFFVKYLTTLSRNFGMPTIESIKRFVQMGMGVAIVPRMCVRWEVERKLLAEVRIRQLKMPRSLYLVSRRGARLSHAAVGLMRLLNA